jgi:hypothetical protein
MGLDDFLVSVTVLTSYLAAYALVRALFPGAVMNTTLKASLVALAIPMTLFVLAVWAKPDLPDSYVMDEPEDKLALLQEKLARAQDISSEERRQKQDAERELAKAKAELAKLKTPVLVQAPTIVPRVAAFEARVCKKEPPRTTIKIIFRSPKRKVVPPSAGSASDLLHDQVNAAYRASP